MNVSIDRIRERILTALPSGLVELAGSLGYETYAVGGSVRDALLDKNPGDVDLAVVGDAPDLARKLGKALGSRSIAVYARFGTALLQIGDRKVELATARRESYSKESRNPSVVIPCPIEEDLARRDFTVNSIALGLTGPRSGELLDRFGGVEDLEARLLRTPLDPDATFSDDPLRMLRAIRFAANLGFEIAPTTFDGVRGNAERLKIVAPERIGDEFWKMLEGPDPVRAMALLIESGLMAFVVPETLAMSGVEQVGRHQHKDVLIHSLKVMQNVAEVSDDPVVRLSALLHDIGKPKTKRFDAEVGWTFHNHEAVGARMTLKIGQRLKLGRERLKRLVNLVQNHMRPVNLTDEGVTDSAIRRLMVDAGEGLDDQLILCRADITTANPKLVHRYLNNFEEMERRMKDVAARDRLRAFQSPVRGEEIMELCGVPAGPLVGALKGRVEDAILDGVISYEHEAARDYLLKIKEEVLRMSGDEISVETRTRARERRRISAEFQIPESPAGAPMEGGS